MSLSQSILLFLIPTKNHLVIEALLYVVCLPIPSLPAAKISFFLSLRSSQLSDLPQEISCLAAPWAHHVVLVHLGTAPLAQSQHLGVGFGKSLNLLFHSSCVYMEAVASHLSLA